MFTDSAASGVAMPMIGCLEPQRQVTINRMDPPRLTGSVPVSGGGQSCAFCGNGDVVWVHPLADDLVAYRS
jgi:hypothetical protein